MELNQVKAWFEAHWDEYLSDLAALVAINSEKGAPLPDAPFGAGPRDALKLALEQAAGYGFTVASDDNYVGTVDLNPDAPAQLDILAHLDVVPAGEGWSITDPFVMKQVDGRLYGRGTADDKGPALAALYAMRCVRDLGAPMTKRCRLILGTDEECGSSDIAHYYAHTPEAPMCFSPDADFPLINVEKGRYHGSAAKALSSPLSGSIVSLNAGVKFNVVPGKARCVLRGVDPELVRTVAETIRARTLADYTVTETDGLIHIVAEGKQAHGSTPDLGNNALTALMLLLLALPLVEDESLELIRKLYTIFPHGDNFGDAAGIYCTDETGVSTLGLHLLRLDDDGLYCEWDCRLPASATEEQVKVLTDRIAALGIPCEAKFDPPHCVSPDSPLVKTLLDCYTACTGLEGYCMAIGGGTYVHHLKNGVAFGCVFPGTETNMHSTHESAVEEELKRSGEIFAMAIAQLCR